MIYHYCLCVPPLSSKDSCSRDSSPDDLDAAVLCISSRSCSEAPMPDEHFGIWTDLLAVNKFIHKEASEYFFRSRTFGFWELDSL